MCERGRFFFAMVSDEHAELVLVREEGGADGRLK